MKLNPQSRHYDRIMYGIRVAQKERVPIGNTCAHISDETTYCLVSYEDGGKTAVLSWDGTIKRFPACEVFDPNTVKRIALGTLVSNN